MKAYVNRLSQDNAQQIKQSGKEIQAQITNWQSRLSQDELALASASRTGSDTTPARDSIATDEQELSALASDLTSIDASQATTLDAVSIGEDAAAPSKPASPNVLLNTVAGAWSRYCSQRALRTSVNSSARGSRPPKTFVSALVFRVWVWSRGSGISRRVEAGHGKPTPRRSGEGSLPAPAN